MDTNGAMVSYAQNREDVLLARVFRDVAEGFYVDVGANDPEHCSVTKHFYDRGWRGINVEPARVFERLAAARPRDVNLNVAASDSPGRLTLYEYEEGVLSGLSSLHPEAAGDDADLAARRVAREVEVRPLRDILAEHAPGRIDFLSVDVELHERQVLLGNDWQRFRPRVVLVEATQPRTSLPAFQPWEGILLEAGYDFVYFDGLNRYYLRREDADLKARFDAPVNVFDNYIPAQAVELHDRVGHLLIDLDRKAQQLDAQGERLANSRLEAEQWRENASQWCERADQARQETALAKDEAAQARAELIQSRHETEQARHERSLVEEQLRQLDAARAAERAAAAANLATAVADRAAAVANCAAVGAELDDARRQLAAAAADRAAVGAAFDDARRQLAAAGAALEETHGRLVDALRLFGEQGATLRDTAGQLAEAHALVTSLTAQVEGFERLGARPLALLGRWARFRDGHPRLMRVLKRVAR